MLQISRIFCMAKLRFAPVQASIIKETRNVLGGREGGGGRGEGSRQNLSGQI